MMEDGPQVLPLPPPVTLEPISRPSSTSTSASLPLPQLPSISSLAGVGSAASSPQLRATNIPPPLYAGSSPAATSGGGGSNLPTCQNCTTSTTPLWRRDEFGSVLCNACGLFLKLHGRPRPISLKTDVIKSRNRVKSIRPDLASKKKQQVQQAPPPAYAPVATDPNGIDLAAQNNANPLVAHAARRTSQKSANGHTDGSHSPVSRTATPSMYNPHLPVYPGIDDAHFQGATLPPYPPPSADPGRPASPMNGERHLGVPQTHEELIAANSSLKTRVSELEVINDLFRTRLSQLEQEELTARQDREASGQAEKRLRTQQEAMEQAEKQLRTQLEDSHRRENNLKQRLDELEVELKAAKDALQEALSQADSERPAKKPRLDDSVKAETAEPQPEA